MLTRRSLLCGIAAEVVTARLLAQERPRRIVSTAPSITEALFALGLGNQVVGVSRFCNFPASVQKLPKVETYISPKASESLPPEFRVNAYSLNAFATRIR